MTGVGSVGVALALGCGYSAKALARRDFYMLRCYVDESGTGGEPIMVLAGFVAPIADWALFSEEWQECLDMRPRMPYLHMTEFTKSWGEQSRDRFTRFRYIAEKHATASVSIAINRAEYDRVFGKFGDWKNPYLFMLFVLIRDYQYLSRALGLSRKAEFVFDEQSSAMSKIFEAWESFRTQSPAFLEPVSGPPQFQNDREILPLQAADMLAWVLRRHMQDDYNGAKRFDIPEHGGIKAPGIAIRYTEELLLRERLLMMSSDDDVKLLLKLGMLP